MLTKEYIKEVITSGNGGVENLIKSYQDIGTITFILEHLGQLPKNFDGSFLPTLMQHKSAAVRLGVVKTIGKLKNEEYLGLLKEVTKNEQDTTVRREAVSSIGRMRNPIAKEILFEILDDNDPKVVCQAIRGLLVFKGDKDVDEHLQPLINHLNEMVRTVIYKEFFTKAA